ncbi:hypothetical protein P691DRAFT_804436 [Macrolepiota fuliginosa MF-IS2]|uniref:Serine-threonine/tyrosine-protein kinase catalytic domain-containing protein n=1 Tax=Macrolepiota fuliginosa MF-IS2 TaxID=1400762 RepID=A0A9P5X7E3_9AGAR|nr:hypothetical protein P691DRAFT_804436 [Macrolepiota fuliginosa MF-IS2]
MTRTTPYGTGTYIRVIMGITKGNLPVRPEGGSRPGVDQIDDVMWDLMQSCWAREPKDRPTCEQILQRPEFTALANERKDEDEDRMLEEKWQFQHAMSQAEEEHTDLARVEEILEELKKL